MYLYMYMYMFVGVFSHFLLHIGVPANFLLPLSLWLSSPPTPDPPSH